jgi:arabinose-5-phosphate isomerase
MPRNIARKVLDLEARAILDLIPRLSDGFDRAVEILHGCKGRVIVTGMGKSGLIGAKIAATFSSTGTPSISMHPADAVHGDVGVVVPGDAVLAISYSGETEELLRLLEILKRLDVALIAMTGHRDSTLARHAQISLDVGIAEEASPLGLVPTASTTAALAMGDALAMALVERRGFTLEDFARIHPGGRLGRRVMTVGQLMHTGADIPRVASGTALLDAVRVMTEKRLGMTCVTDERGVLIGLLTDGDLRRAMMRGPAPATLSVDQAMTRSPVTIRRDELAAKALGVLEERRITVLVVADDAGLIEGVLHLHDLWRTQLF